MGGEYYNASVPAHVPADRVHDFDVYRFSPDPFITVHSLFEKKIPEIFWTRHNGGHWLARGAETITAVTRDPELFSSAKIFVPDHRNPAQSFLPGQSDPPMHMQYRRILAPLFSPERIRALEQRIEAVCDELIDEVLARGECEFMEDFAAEMPVIVFLSLVDLPLDDRRLLRAISSRINDPEGTRAGGLQELFDYLGPIIKQRIQNPGEDVISRIVSEPVNGRPLDADEMIRLVSSVLLGGLDTVASQLGFFVRHLADSERDRKRLIAQPDMVRPAVDEILRRFSIAYTTREVTKDTVFRGVRMMKKDLIAWTMSMYNLDDSIFPDPLSVDFDRKRKQNGSFGSGEHFCAGAFLARAELRIFVERWLKRVPEFSVAPDTVFEYRSSNLISYKKLPLIIHA